MRIAPQPFLSSQDLNIPFDGPLSKPFIDHGYMYCKIPRQMHGRKSSDYSEEHSGVRKSFRSARLPSFRVMRLYSRYSRTPNIFCAAPIRIATICLCAYPQRELGTQSIGRAWKGFTALKRRLRILFLRGHFAIPGSLYTCKNSWLGCDLQVLADIYIT